MSVRKMAEDQPPLKRVRLSEDSLMEMKREDLLHKWKQQDEYVDFLESARAMHTGDEDADEKLRQQQSEFTRKEKIQILRLSTKEQEFQELANKLAEMSKNQTPGANQLRSSLLDPALNLLFQRMKKELEDKNKQLQQAQEDMTAWKFTSDSQTGKRLMARCRTLLQENQDLGKQVSSGKIANLDAELAIQKKYNEELKGSQDELYEMVLQLNEEGEGMQSTICALQQQLREAQDKLAKYEGNPSTTDTNSALTALATVEPPLLVTNQEKTDKGYERTEDTTDNNETGKTNTNEIYFDDDDTVKKSNYSIKEGEDKEGGDSIGEVIKDPEKNQVSWERGVRSGSTSPKVDSLRDSVAKDSRTTTGQDLSEQYETSQVDLEASQVRTTTVKRGSPLRGVDHDTHNHHDHQLIASPPPSEIVSPSDPPNRTESLREGSIEGEEMDDDSSYADVEAISTGDVSFKSGEDDFERQADSSSLDMRTSHEMSPDSPPPSESVLPEVGDLAESKDVEGVIESINENDSKTGWSESCERTAAVDATNQIPNNEKIGSDMLQDSKQIAGNSLDRERWTDKLQGKEKGIDLIQGDLQGRNGAAGQVQERDITTGQMQDEKIPGYLQDNERTPGYMQENERTADRLQDNERTTHHTQDSGWTTSEMQEKDRIVDLTQKNVRTEALMQENERTTDHMQENERTTDNMQEKERTTDNMQEKERTTDLMQDSEGTMECRTQEDAGAKFEVIGKDHDTVDDHLRGDDDGGDDSVSNQDEKVVDNYFSEKDEESVENSGGNPSSPENNGDVTTPMSPQSPENHSEPSNYGNDDDDNGDTVDDIEMVSKADSDTSESDCRPLNELNATKGMRTANGLENDLSKDSDLPNHSLEMERNMTLKAQGEERTNGPSATRGQSVRTDSHEEEEEGTGVLSII